MDIVFGVALVLGAGICLGIAAILAYTTCRATVSFAAEVLGYGVAGFLILAGLLGWKANGLLGDPIAEFSWHDLLAVFTGVVISSIFAVCSLVFLRHKQRKSQPAIEQLNHS